VGAFGGETPAAKGKEGPREHVFRARVEITESI